MMGELHTPGARLPERHDTLRGRRRTHPLPRAVLTVSKCGLRL